MFVASWINVFLVTGGESYLPFNSRSGLLLLLLQVQWCTVIDTSKLTSSFSAIFYWDSLIHLVDELILHSFTTGSQSLTCVAILWYADPGIDSTGCTGTIYTVTLCTFARPYRCFSMFIFLRNCWKIAPGDGSQKHCV